MLSQVYRHQPKMLRTLTSSALFVVSALMLWSGRACAFEYFEHKYIGDVACEALKASGKLPPTLGCALWSPDVDIETEILHLQPRGLTFGDIVALAGDHYSVTDGRCELCDFVEEAARNATPIPPRKLAAILAARDAQQVEVERWERQIGSDGSMKTSEIEYLRKALDASGGGGVKMTADKLSESVIGLADEAASGIHVLMSSPREADMATTLDATQEIVGEGVIFGSAILDQVRRAAPGVRTILSSLRDTKTKGAKCFVDSEYLAEGFNSLEDYLRLASSNYDHFGTKAFERYVTLHRTAIDLYAIGNARRALVIEAEALHFLTDLFAAGHIRTPRDDLTSAEAKARHDWDNQNGLIVRAYLRSDRGAEGYIGAYWVSHRDGCLLGTPTVANRRLVTMIASYSLMQVFDAADRTRTFYRPAAVPITAVNPYPPATPTHHLAIALGTGVISPVLNNAGKVIAPVELSGIVGLSYSSPVKPWAIDSRLVAVSREIRVSPFGLAIERTTGDWGTRMVFFEPVVRITSSSRIGGIAADLRGELSYLVYPPVELRLSIGFLLRGWTFNDDVGPGGGEPHGDLLVAYRFSTF